MKTLLAADGLGFSYDTAPVLDSVDVHIESGECVGLVGPNGAGKTTLLHVLLGLLPAQSGRVLLDGTPLSELTRREVARRATLVPQETRTDFALTVRELVAMGRSPHLGRFQPERQRDSEAIERALALTECSAFSDRLLSELSGGERQRVHIARAIAQETPLLLLDEPTASLDLEHQLQLMGLVRELVRGGKGVLAALHDLNLASRYCDRLVVLGSRSIVADGEPSEIITEEALARHFRIRARVDRDPETGAVIVVPLSPLPPA